MEKSPPPIIWNKIKIIFNVNKCDPKSQSPFQYSATQPFTTFFGMKTSKRVPFLVFHSSYCRMTELTDSSLTPLRLLFHLSFCPFVLM